LGNRQQIVGPDFCINPVEGFVLGCSFLFHDCNDHGSVPESGRNKDSREWKRIYRIKALSNADIDDSYIIEIFLREQHAIRAEKLPKISWKADSGFRYLIDDGELQRSLAILLGK
jgi:hypothetical protein